LASLSRHSKGHDFKPFAARPKNVIPPKTVKNSQYRR